jgi:4-hydroxy-tetrahydrodipicolinate synthase
MEFSQISGIGVALVTPFSEDGSVDYDALEKVIEHVIAGGVDHLVPLGTTGETPTLSNQEKMDIIRFTVEKAGNRKPVVVGIGGNNTREIIHHLETYPLDGVSAILSVSPYYSKPSSEGLYQHYKAVAAATSKPVILYNVPHRTGRNIPADVTLRLAGEIENIVAIKEASGDMVQCMQIIRDKPADFTVVSGDDMLTMSQIACGMRGVISVAGNFMAKDMSDMIHAALSSDFGEARRLHYKMMHGFELMFAENNPAGVKAFMSAAGICGNNFRLPVVPVSDGLMHRIKDYLKTYEAGSK